MNKIAFIFHGRIKCAEKKFEGHKKTLPEGYEAKLFITLHTGHATELAMQAIKENCWCILCLGGDGSINEVANGIMKMKSFVSDEDWRKIRLGILPMGTGNDFRRTLNCPITMQTLFESIVADRYKEIDLGLVHFHTKDGNASSRYFVNITDLGMGGMAAEKLATYSKWMGAYLTYQRVIISTFLQYTNQAISAITDSGVQFKGKVMNYVIANGQYFAGGLGVAPEADPTDGNLSIVIIGEISIWDYLKNFGNLKNCRKLNHPKIQYTSAKSVEVSAVENQLPVDMDGEFIGYTPIKAEVVEKVLRLLV